MMAHDFDDVHVRYVDVDAEGVADLDSLRGVVNEHTAIVSVMAVNNETGVRQPLDGVTAVVRTCPATRSPTPTRSPPRPGSVSRS